MTENVSIYVPTYNAEKTITFSIEAILNQTLLPNQIIIINDCSSDNTLKKINIYKNKIEIVNNEINKGLGYCRNLGLEMSKNNLVASIDSDVVPEKDWLKNLYDCLKKNNSAYCGGKLIEKNIDNNIYNKWRSVHLIQHWGERSMQNPPFIYGCNNLLNKEKIFKKIYYDENLKTNGEDVDFSGKLSINKLSTFYDHKAICYHIQNDNMNSLSKRYWRYRTYGYKIKSFSYLKLIKLSIKEVKMLLNRIIKDLKYKKYDLLFLEIIIYFKFVMYEFNETIIKRR